MANKQLTKSYIASGAVLKRAIVKLASDTQVSTATAATDLLLGVADSSYDIATTERVDVITHGIAEVVAGGNITRGNMVTADSSGYAVQAAPSAGVNNRVLGVAMVSAVSGDIFDVLLAQHLIQGA